MFLLYDTGEDDPNRIIIFATEENLKLLNSENVWYVDGTFSISPEVFKQVFTINIIKANRNLALVYCLLPNKQEISYTRVLNLLKSNGVTIIPKYILCDYELAVINSIKKCFPGTNIGGCYFNLAANLWKHVSNGLRKTYRSDQEFKLYFKYLKCLPFVPPNSLFTLFNDLKSKCPDSIKPFYDYFENYYIGLPKTTGSKVRTIPPFPIETWNVVKRVYDNLPRSNNSIEAWHKALAQDIN